MNTETETIEPWNSHVFSRVALNHYFEKMRLFSSFYQLPFKLQSHWTTKQQYLQEGLYLQGDESTGHMGFITSAFIGAICWQMPKKEYRVISNNKTFWRSFPQMLSGRETEPDSLTKEVFCTFPLAVFIHHLRRNFRCFRSKPISKLWFIKIAKGFYLSLFANPSQQLKRIGV